MYEYRLEYILKTKEEEAEGVIFIKSDHELDESTDEDRTFIKQQFDKYTCIPRTEANYIKWDLIPIINTMNPPGYKR